jgi:hypothetical protein
MKKINHLKRARRAQAAPNPKRQRIRLDFAAPTTKEATHHDVDYEREAEK